MGTVWRRHSFEFYKWILLLRNSILYKVVVLLLPRNINFIILANPTIYSSLSRPQYTCRRLVSSYRNQLFTSVILTDFTILSIVFFIRIKIYFDKKNFFTIWPKISYMLEKLFFWKNNNNNHKYNYPKNILEKKSNFFKINRKISKI